MKRNTFFLSILIGLVLINMSMIFGQIQIQSISNNSKQELLVRWRVYGEEPEQIKFYLSGNSKMQGKSFSVDDLVVQYGEGYIFYELGVFSYEVQKKFAQIDSVYYIWVETNSSVDSAKGYTSFVQDLTVLGQSDNSVTWSWSDMLSQKKDIEFGYYQIHSRIGNNYYDYSQDFLENTESTVFSPYKQSVSADEFSTIITSTAYLVGYDHVKWQASGTPVVVFQTTGISEITKPEHFVLNQNYPNPFNPFTTIEYNISQANNIKLVVYDMLGREVKTLVNSFQNAGNYTVQFDGTQLPSGRYFYQLIIAGESNPITLSKSMLLIK